MDNYSYYMKHSASKTKYYEIKKKKKITLKEKQSQFGLMGARASAKVVTTNTKIKPYK